ncbi:MAG: ATPase, T2SS/T4P/T4SS family [Gallionella sp.]|nr:ATPase, T2SS/T4P/T4SS family [Gallionella sp.]
MSALLRQHLKPFEPYFAREGLTEISINRPGELWLKSPAGKEVVKDKAFTLQLLNDLASTLATHKKQRFDEYAPMLGTTIPGYNYRIQIVGGAVADSGFTASIRIPQPGRYPVEDYFDDPAEAAKLIEAVGGHGRTVAVVGPMGSGKTTFANSLIARIPMHKRFVVVEDARELVIEQPDQARLLKSKSGTDLASITYDQIGDALKRLTPDWIAFGELDNKNTSAFLDMSGTGHPCITTMHSDNADRALMRIARMAQASGLQGGLDVAMGIVEMNVHALIFIRKDEEKRTFRARVQYLGG